MDSILDALQEGRLFELPDNDKRDALQFLARIIEAFPEIPAGTDIEGLVMKREETVNSALGKGWACPHARLPFDEDLKCVIGWSPVGIPYGARDGRPVRLIVMYMVPENQRNHYLREISFLAKAIAVYPDLEKIGDLAGLDEVRNYLLDVIVATKESALLDTRARMIRLQAKPTPVAGVFPDLSNLVVEAVTLVAGPGIPPVALTQNKDLTDRLEGMTDLVARLEREGACQVNGWHLVRRGATSYQGGRVLYDCLALKMLWGKGGP